MAAKYFTIPEKIQNIIDKALTVDTVHIDKQLEENISYEAFLNKLLYETNETLIEHEIERDELAKTLRIKYITGNTDDKDGDIRFNRSELETIINGDRRMLVLNQKIKELNNIIKYYERAYQNIKQKNFNLRDIINYRKFQAGGDV